MPENLTLAAARTVPWADPIVLFYQGDALPLEGATVKMQIRQYPGAPGAALSDQADVAFEDGAATDDEMSALSLSGAWRALRLFPEISEVTLAGFPTGLNKPEPGEADAFSYDVVIEYADADADRPIAGTFLLEPGVTD